MIVVCILKLNYIELAACIYINRIVVDTIIYMFVTEHVHCNHGSMLVNEVFDNMITSSSEYGDEYLPKSARLSTVAVTGVQGAWRSKSNDLHQYIQVLV